jgi:hypothetical protein
MSEEDKRIHATEMALEVIKANLHTRDKYMEDIKLDLGVLHKELREAKHGTLNGLNGVSLQVTTMSHELKSNAAMIIRMMEKTSQLDEILVGKGMDDMGLRGKIASIEQLQKQRSHQLAALWVIISGVLIKVLTDVFMNVIK